jgi:hypothetical protein
MTLAVETIPTVILTSPRGVLWNFETRNGKPTKIPYVATDPARKAKSNDPSTWRPFGVAVEAVHEGKADGAGVVLGDGHAGVDLDKCRDLVTGQIAAWAQEIISAVDSYTEISPSATGVKIFVQVDPALTLRNGKHNRPDGSAIEMFASGKFFTVSWPASCRHADDDRRTDGRVPGVASAVLLRAPERPASAAADADRRRSGPPRSRVSSGERREVRRAVAGGSEPLRLTERGRPGPLQPARVLDWRRCRTHGSVVSAIGVDARQVGHPPK